MSSRGASSERQRHTVAMTGSGKREGSALNAELVVDLCGLQRDLMPLLREREIRCLHGANDALRQRDVEVHVRRTTDRLEGDRA